MPLVYLVRWCKGIVSFELSGGDIGCFLNLVAKANICLFSLNSSESYVNAHCFLADLEKILCYAQKSGCDVLIKQKRGLPFLLKRYKKRIGIIIGIVLFFAVVIFSSQFIWTVDIKGNEEVTLDEIKTALSQIGVKVGAYIPSLDAKILEEKLLLLVDKLSWCAINLQGSTAFIEIKEREIPPEMQTDETPCNIIAKKSGVIRKIEVYEGQAVVLENEGVSEGNLLISGIIVTKKGNTYLKHATGIVLAEVEYCYSVEVPFCEQVAEKIGKTHNRYYINIVSHRIPLWFYKDIANCEITETESHIKIFGTEYPIGIVKAVCEEVQYKEVEISLKDAKEKAKKLLYAKIDEELKGCEIVKKSFSGEQKQDKYIISGSCIVLEDICETEKILIKNP